MGSIRCSSTSATTSAIRRKSSTRSVRLRRLPQPTSSTSVSARARTKSYPIGIGTARRRTRSRRSRMSHDGPKDAASFKTIPKDLRQRLVIGAVVEERFFQDRKHGTIEESPHTPAGWMLLIEAELEEAKDAVIKGGMGRDGWRQ